MSLRSLVPVVLSLASCSGALQDRPEQEIPEQEIPEEVALVLPPVDDTLMLGLAGVPNDLLGDESAPQFAEVFASLAGYGFDRFVPVFLTDENGEGGAYGTYFIPQQALPAEVFGPIPEESTCEGPYNPWQAAAGALEIVFPGYLLALDQPVTAPFDRDLLEARFEAFASDCLGGDTSKAKEIYSYDEPANNYASSLCCDSDPASTFALSNVAMMEEISSDVLGADTLLVEAPLPFFLPLVAEAWAIDASLIDGMIEDFEDGVEATAPHADRYGFDIYPVDLTSSLSVIPEHVALAKRNAPQAEPIIVLQGFGMADMNIDVGTPGRRPTRDETRAMAFLSVSAGARGVYWYGQSALDSGDSLWTDLREVARDLRALSGIFALPATTLAGEVTIPDGVTLDVREGEGVTWVLLVDREGQGSQISLPVSPTSHTLDALDGEAISAVDNVLSVTLPAYGSRMLALFESR